MAPRTSVIWDDAFTAYDFGPTHPMGPARLDLTTRLCRALGVFDHVDLLCPGVAADDVLATVHDRDYIDAVRRGSKDPDNADVSRGLGTEDDPAFLGMHEASARIAQGTLDLCRRVWRGEAEHGVNYCGGLHHAMADHASGFCIYNDVAVAIQWLLDAGCQRIAYVDVDVHHGDGVQAIFYDDPRVLTISLHETPVCLFPGTGFPYEIGGPHARGSAVNIALPPGTTDAGWLRAFHAVVPQVLAEHRPSVLVSQHGCDSHRRDPLADLNLSVDGQRASYLAVAELADRFCGGRWISTGGGGYVLLDVVPRAWTHLLAIVGGRPLPPETAIPQAWREEVGGSGAVSMSDGVDPAYVSFDAGFSPESRLDQAIVATRRAVFPELGLDLGV
jgi:acetoin utilization protein AcuC